MELAISLQNRLTLQETWRKKWDRQGYYWHNEHTGEWYYEEQAEEARDRWALLETWKGGLVYKYWYNSVSGEWYFKY